jgi:hypothetical protein
MLCTPNANPILNNLPCSAPFKISGPYGKVNPKPAIQLLYLSIVEEQSFCASADLLKSIHSSRVAFSSLQTQHGYCQSVQSFIRLWTSENPGRRTFGPVLATFSGCAAATADEPVAGSCQIRSFGEQVAYLRIEMAGEDILKLVLRCGRCGCEEERGRLDG